MFKPSPRLLLPAALAISLAIVLGGAFVDAPRALTIQRGILP